MAVTRDSSEIYWDPFDTEMNANPYGLFRRMRDAAPLYFSEQYGFYAVTRADDVERSFTDSKRLINARGAVVDFVIIPDITFPPGIFIFEDAPQHTKHRGLLSRVFTPRRMLELEPQVREFCAKCLGQFMDSDGFDFVKDYAEIVSSRSIGLLLGIPEGDQMAVRQHVDSRSGPHQAEEVDTHFDSDYYADYLDWRETHPSDDLMTALLNVEFEDEHATTRRLTREEVLMYVTLLSGAGNDTTAKLIGWTGKVLSDNPGERKLLVDDPALIPDAVEELLRYEPPGMQNARFAVEDVEFSGGTVPAGSPVVCVMASANHDERRFPDPERFDVRRRPVGIMTFAFGSHFCLGAALARLQGRVALEEVLKRFPEWTVDVDRSELQVTSTTRGWSTLPVQF
jgi:cytochrome P450